MLNPTKKRRYKKSLHAIPIIWITGEIEEVEDNREHPGQSGLQRTTCTPQLDPSTRLSQDMKTYIRKI